MVDWRRLPQPPAVPPLDLGRGRCRTTRSALAEGQPLARPPAHRFARGVGRGGGHRVPDGLPTLPAVGQPDEDLLSEGGGPSGSPYASDPDARRREVLSRCGRTWV
jgi:hypothetical protein